MSEFYSLRRNAITDMSAFFGFLIGFLGSAPMAWPYLQVGFQTAQIVKGFAWFIAITFGSGVALGIFGLGVGRILGSIWERGHRVVRRARGQEFAIDGPPASAPDVQESLRRGQAEGFSPADVAREPIRVASDFTVQELVDLAIRSELPPPETDMLKESLGHTINIGAYVGDRLVGVLRMLTDGYEWTVVTDFLVEPAYRRRGVGSALMRQAANRAIGRLAVAQIPPGTEGFFRRLEVIPVYEDFVRGSKSRLQ